MRCLISVHNEADVRLLKAVIRILLSAGGTSFAADLSGIDGYLRAEMELNDLPGAAVAVWRKDDIIYAKGFGVRSTATGEPMTADTPVDHASVSKSLTAVAVNQLSRQGKIDLDAPVAKYLPELSGAFTRVRIRHLIRHTSVLTRRHDVLVTCCGQGGESGLHEAAQRFRCSCGNPCSGPWGCSGRRWIARMGVG
jgi:CubicO group peptidase (beta-lactamase class C family)